MSAIRIEARTLTVPTNPAEDLQKRSRGTLSGSRGGTVAEITEKSDKTPKEDRRIGFRPPPKRIATLMDAIQRHLNESRESGEPPAPPEQSQER